MEMHYRDKFRETIFPGGRFIELKMFQFGYNHCPPRHSVGPDTWGQFLFHYIISGKGVLYSASENGVRHKFKLGAGQGFMIWPEQVSTYIADSKEPWEYAWIMFEGMRAKEIVMQAGLEYNNPIYNSTDAEMQEQMRKELMSIVNNPHRPPLGQMGHFYLFLNALIQSSESRNLTYGDGLHDSRVQKAIAYIETNYSQAITVQEVADHCGVHRSYLNRIFYLSLNTNPQTFIINYKIEKSCELLRFTDSAISEISKMVGYQNQHNFSQTFKRVKGMSPHQWKKKRSMDEFE